MAYVIGLQFIYVKIGRTKRGLNANIGGKPVKILVMNCGSSSIKYRLFDMNDESVLATGIVEKIGMKSARVKHVVKDHEEVFSTKISDHQDGVQNILHLLFDSEKRVIQSPLEVKAVGHRVVHGGEYFFESVVIDQNVRQVIQKTIELAPLHNQPNLFGIDAAQHYLPQATHVAVFDTAFHQTIPDYAFMYPLPQWLYKKYQIRRYGFHGTSHQYVSRRCAQLLNKPIESLNMISCHIGNGVSITAINQGKSVDTSMGMTPLEGLMMGTRCGSIDPAIIPFVMVKEELTLHEVEALLNQKSGLLGISEVSSDLREVLEAQANGNQNASLAIDMYVYRMRKMIGAYFAVLNGGDVIIFTGGVGENSAYIRKRICEGLSFLGVELDEEANGRDEEKERLISTPSSKVDVMVIPTNEELMIARETQALVEKIF